MTRKMGRDRYTKCAPSSDPHGDSTARDRLMPLERSDELGHVQVCHRHLHLGHLVDYGVHSFAGPLA